MRWIALLVTTCLVALGALHAPRAPSMHDARRALLDDATGTFAKLAPRPPVAHAPDKHGERIDLVVPTASAHIDRREQLALVAVLAVPRATCLRVLLPRYSRGPPGSSSFGVILHVS
ncbi:MAG TPA: hypothetical protein VM513_27225 [Kofleriaceae bacterium]|jgi:hypothetical protein|nr:hypothetical protein [Kofleriaceae bacterium]